MFPPHIQKEIELAAATEVRLQSVATGLRGYQFHREHRLPGTRPVARGRFFALTVLRLDVHGRAFDWRRRPGHVLPELESAVSQESCFIGR